MFKRIKELRLRENLSQEEVANILNIQREVYRRYETGTRLIPVNLLIKLADYYKVSLDYIVDRES